MISVLCLLNYPSTSTASYTASRPLHWLLSLPGMPLPRLAALAGPSFPACRCSLTHVTRISYLTLYRSPLSYPLVIMELAISFTYLVHSLSSLLACEPMNTEALSAYSSPVSGIVLGTE